MVIVVMELLIVMEVYDDDGNELNLNEYIKILVALVTYRTSHCTNISSRYKLF